MQLLLAARRSRFCKLGSVAVVSGSTALKSGSIVLLVGESGSGDGGGAVMPPKRARITGFCRWGLPEPSTCLSLHCRDSVTTPDNQIASRSTVHTFAANTRGPRRGKPLACAPLWGLPFSKLTFVLRACSNISTASARLKV